jgi:hypothetical protein
MIINIFFQTVSKFLTEVSSIEILDGTRDSKQRIVRHPPTQLTQFIRSYTGRQIITNIHMDSIILSWLFAA